MRQDTVYLGSLLVSIIISIILYFKWAFTKFFGIFEKNDFFTFFKKVQNRVFGQFWPQIRKEHQKLGGEGAFGLTKTYFSENI